MCWCPSAVCGIKLHVQSVQYRRSLYAEYAVFVGHQLPGGGGGAPSQLLKKKKWHAIPASAPVTARGWMQMIIIDGQLCLWKDIRNPEPRKTTKRWRPYCMRHFQIGYIHNPVKLFWVLRLITCFNVGNNFTTTNASNILSAFPCSLTKVSHGFNTQKKRIMVLIAMVTAY